MDLIVARQCADWSPDPNRPDLIACGLTTGKTLLVRLQDHVLGDIAYGSSENLHSPTGPSRSASTTSNRAQPHTTVAPIQYPVLSVKMSRPCNVVSFSKTNPHLLAAGLDKVRNDPCLLVWDVSQAVDSYNNTPTGSQTPTPAHHSSQVEPRMTISSNWKLDDELRNRNPQDVLFGGRSSEHTMRGKHHICLLVISKTAQDTVSRIYRSIRLNNNICLVQGKGP